MSWRATSWAAEQVTGKPLAKLVLLKLADNANDAGVAWPSLDTISAHTELSRRAVQKHLAILEALGLIVIEERKTESGASLANKYRLNMAMGEGARRAPQGAPDAGGDAPPCTGRVHMPAPPKQPPLEPSENRHSLAPVGAGEGEVPASLGQGSAERFPEFRSAWAEACPLGFPRQDEGAAEAEFARQTRLVDAETLIAAARLHGKAETLRKAGRKGDDFRTKNPSTWLRDGSWKGYSRELEAAAESQNKTAVALGRVREALGAGVMDILTRRGMPEATIAALDGVTFHEGPPAQFAGVSAFQRTLLERHEPALRSQFGDGLRIITGGKAGASR